MRVRFETENGQLIEEVIYPHAELPLGDTLLLNVHGKSRIRYCVLNVDMITDSGELKALVTVRPADPAH